MPCLSTLNHTNTNHSSKSQFTKTPKQPITELSYIPCSQINLHRSENPTAQFYYEIEMTDDVICKVEITHRLERLTLPESVADYTNMDFKIPQQISYVRYCGTVCQPHQHFPDFLRPFSRRIGDIHDNN